MRFRGSEVQGSGVQGPGFRVQRFRGYRFRGSGFSPAAGHKKRPAKSRKKLMNIEHRTSNIERRIMYSIYFIKD